MAAFCLLHGLCNDITGNCDRDVSFYNWINNTGSVGSIMTMLIFPFDAHKNPIDMGCCQYGCEALVNSNVTGKMEEIG